ncbi:hypothetical protein SAMN04488543_3712 [Friedmanniella luteola]|uniref:Uncharacterized protein n=1 Tax=Friedmanniella luteola TaxID=546871 RepID=A0A1H1ZDN4_9ACTN|nr:hypothetical protein [Friedmanniella luteola]SDT31895.1 hypothetical protein SAMN04488543_3712 [Friedmanniella luteola]
MSVEVMAEPTSPVTGHRPLTLLREPHPALDAQQAFATAAALVLRRAGASGQRLTTALHLILAEHAGLPVVDGPEGLHLRCTRCRDEDREPAAQYPCPTAQQAFWALDAVLG